MNWLGKSGRELRKTVVASILALFFATNSVNATLGPVRVELNLTKPKMSHARANSVNAFKISFRYNVDIKYNDWYRIWFPIDEFTNSDNPEDVVGEICDGLPVIDERINNPRFIPNNEYFDKFDNPELSKVRQIYEGKNDNGCYNFASCPDVSEISDWGSACGKELKKYRIIKDPSGLGCWMLGTVMPSMPFDQEKLINKLQAIMRSTLFCYTPCSECQGYAIIVNNCLERSYQEYASLSVEAWRKGYNSIDWNSTANTGIVAPATPGRYKVAVATKPEPEPVESEAFVLPCSKITTPTATVNVLENPVSLLRVSFSTGEGGALDGGTSQITLRFPPAVKLPNELSKGSVLINGKTPAEYSMRVISKNNLQTLTFTTNVDVENMGSVTIDFLPSSKISVKDSTRPVQIEVSTSSEPEFVKSGEFIPRYESASIASGRYEGEILDLTIRAAVEKPTKSGDIVTISLPEGFMVPRTIKADSITIDGKPCKGSVNTENTNISFKLPVASNNLAIINVSSKCKIQNPQAGTYKVTLMANEKTIDCGQIEIVKRPEK